MGGFGFAAPALQLGPRDAWIGWDGEQRRDYLHYVVNMNRFLIRPSVHCHNLASKILSQALAVLHLSGLWVCLASMRMCRV